MLEWPTFAEPQAELMWGGKEGAPALAFVARVG